MQIISIYDKETHSKGGGLIDIDIFFSDIQNGKYKKQVEEIRLAKYNFKLEKERCKNLTPEEVKDDHKYHKAKLKLKELKGAIHRVTISGKFSEEGRLEKNLISHSGLIDIDIDGLENDAELNDLKSKLIQDKYCFACFISCGGDGLSFIVRIDTTKVEESWDGLKEYFFNKYRKNIDVTHKNVANTRNTSYDPQIYISDNKPPIFKEYPKVKKDKKKEVKNFLYVKNDFEEIIREIVLRRIDFCNDYESYRDMGFAIASKFGNDGLYYFDAICQWNDKYNKDALEKDYLKYYCKNTNGGKTIASFYARCKEFGIAITSEKTAKIATVASSSRLNGKTKEDVVKNLVKFENLKEEECKDIVDQIFDEKIEFSNELSLLEEIEMYIKHNYNLIKNEITGKLENNGVEWTEEDLNGLYIAVKKVYDKADAKWIEKIIFSRFITSYNPLKDFFKNNKAKIPDELLDKGEIPSIIKRLWKSIYTDNPTYLEKFGTKWLVSCVSAAFGTPSNLELIFTGKLHKGKSWFFKNILPLELQKYFAESKLDSNNANDDYTVLCQKLIVCNDECAGKTKNDEKKHRNLLEKDIFTMRRPYRKDLEDIKRLGVLCGTSNPQNVVPGDNRRVIPVNVLGRDYKAFDDIDKVELWMAIYKLYSEGFKWRIDESEISELNKNTTLFQSYETEYELITRFFESTETGGELLTATDMQVVILKETSIKLSQIKITNELRKLEFIQEQIRENNVPKTVYRVRRINLSQVPGKIVPDYF